MIMVIGTGLGCGLLCVNPRLWPTTMVVRLSGFLDVGNGALISEGALPAMGRMEWAAASLRKTATGLQRAAMNRDDS